MIWDQDERNLYVKTSVIALLAEIQRIDSENSGKPYEPGHFKMYSAADLETHPSHWKIEGDPVRWACKNAIKEFGKELYKTGGMKEMEAMCQIAEDAFGSFGGVMIDKCFDGVGSWWA